MKKQRVYLDNCCFNRPYDSQEQIRIRLESEAKLDIQSRIKEGKVLLVWSFMLDFENSKNIDIEKRDKISGWQQFADSYFMGTTNTEKMADDLVLKGFKSIDAVYIACAIESKCDYFLTTDKGILGRKRLVSEVKIANPIEYIIENGDNHEK